MRKQFWSLGAVAVVVGLMLTPAPAAAQTQLVRTTLAAAITDTSGTVISVTSATGMTAQTTGLMIEGEYMAITAVNGTLISVVRGSDGTRATTHANSTTILVTVAGSTGSVEQFGSCTTNQGDARFEPWINTRTGTLWRCVSSLWQGANELDITWDSNPW
jgi:hypothetical protein|tara:strand:+ start:985 stop:1464 length:480 start_codon:yes stop_codon:yes gene_type:complete